MKKLAWILPTIFAILLVETGRYMGVSNPAPFFVVFVCVVITGSQGGQQSGLIAGAAAGAFVIYAYFQEFGSQILTGSVQQTVFGSIVFLLVGFSLGRLKDQRDAVVRSLRESEQRLASALKKETSEKIAQVAKVAEREASLDTAIRIAGIGHFSFDSATGDCTYCSEQHAKHFGLTPDEYATQTKGRPLRRLYMHADDRQIAEKAIGKVYSGEPQTFDIRAKHPNGEIRYINQIVEPVFGENGKVSSIVGTSIDLTELHEAETRLAKTVANLPGVMQSVEIDREGKFRPKFMSRYCLDMWGYTSEEFWADPNLMASLHDPKDMDDVLSSFLYAAKSLKPIKRRFASTTKTGQAKWLEVHASATSLENGITQVDSIFLDVTAEVNAQKQLKIQSDIAHKAQKHETIGQLTGGVAHDFNNLLAVIMGNLELLRDDLDRDDLVELVDNSIGATLRGAELTRNMLSFARKARLEPKKIDLNQILADIKKWAGRTIPANIDFEMNLSDALWETHADPSSTESALLNLILNARDAMPDGGKLTLETANQHVKEPVVDGCGCAIAPGEYVVLTVRDTGTGIEQSKLARIFEPFYTTKPVGKGSGLGLSMSEGFMKQSGGELLVFSEPEIGTTFKLFFPATETEQLSEADTHDTTNNAVPQGMRILVVEDEPMVLSVIVKVLKRAGYDVISASSGDDALKVFEAKPDFDLVLTDIVMPGELQGTSLAKALRILNPAIPIIFMSGYAEDNSLSENAPAPEGVRLMKPVSRSDLLTKIELALQTPQ